MLRVIYLKENRAERYLTSMKAYKAAQLYVANVGTNEQLDELRYSYEDNKKDFGVLRLVWVEKE